MADIHVVTGDGANWRVVMHIPIPDTNNAVAVNYQTAIINSGIGGKTSLPDGDGLIGTISGAEKTSITSGVLYEHIATFLVESGGTSNAELQATLRSFYTQEKTDILANLQRQLRYFGHTESEA